MGVSHQLQAFERGRLRRRVLVLAGPAAIEMLLHMLVGLADTAMVGRVGPPALAAVGLANQIFMLATTVFAAVATGTTALVARYTGAEQTDKAANAARQSLLLGTAVAGTLLFVLRRWSLSILTFLFGSAEVDVLTLSSDYVAIVALAMVFSFFLITINAILRGAGDTRTPIAITACVNVFNIAVNYLLIFGIGPFPSLGVRGAAVGTALAHTLGGLWALHQIQRSRQVPFRITAPLRPDWTVIRRILSIGIPAALEQTTMRLGQLFFTMIVIALGTASYAAHQVALAVESLAFMPGFAFSLAATALVGQSLAARDPDRAELSGTLAAQFALVSMGALGVIFFVFAVPLAGLFTRDTDVIAAAAMCLRIAAVVQPALAFVLVFSGAMRGAGDTRTLVKITAMGACLLRLVLAYLLAVWLGLGLIGAWLAMAMDLIVRAVWLRKHYARGDWTTLRI